MAQAQVVDKTVEWPPNEGRAGALRIWANRETDVSALEQIAGSHEWSRLASQPGFFAGVYGETDQVCLFSDRLGVFPLFYHNDEGRIRASAELADLLASLPTRPKHCMEGVISLLLFGHHLADETVFEGVRKCKGGEAIVFDKNGNVKETVVWNRRHTYHDQPSIEANELGELFVRGLADRISGEGKILVALSGGFDSRAVLGAALECVESGRLHTLTFGGKDSYDLRVARLVAGKAGVQNTVFPITDQLFADDFLRQRAADYGYGYSAFGTQPEEMLSYLSEEDSQGSISLWGVGGDAITGSHLRPSDLALPPCPSAVDRARLLISKRAFVPLTTACRLTGMSEYDVVTMVAGLIERSGLIYFDEPWQFLDAWDMFVRGRMELIGVLPFHGGSFLCPHLSPEYFGRMSTQCFDDKLGQNAYKRMLSSRFRRLFNLPTRRLKGKSLTGPQWRNLLWIAHWRGARAIESLRTVWRRESDSIGRNYGLNSLFFATEEGRERLERSVDILGQAGILSGDTRSALEISQTNIQAALMLVTLGYAFAG